LVDPSQTQSAISKDRYLPLLRPAVTASAFDPNNYLNGYSDGASYANGGAWNSVDSIASPYFASPEPPAAASTGSLELVDPSDDSPSYIPGNAWALPLMSLSYFGDAAPVDPFHRTVSNDDNAIERVGRIGEQGIAAVHQFGNNFYYR